LTRLAMLAGPEYVKLLRRGLDVNPETGEFVGEVPAEFTKSEWDTLRKFMPLSRLGMLGGPEYVKLLRRGLGIRPEPEAQSPVRSRIESMVESEDESESEVESQDETTSQESSSRFFTMKRMWSYVPGYKTESEAKSSKVTFDLEHKSPYDKKNLLIDGLWSEDEDGVRYRKKNILHDGLWDEDKSSYNKKNLLIDGLWSEDENGIRYRKKNILHDGLWDAEESVAGERVQTGQTQEFSSAALLKNVLLLALLGFLYAGAQLQIQTSIPTLGAGESYTECKIPSLGASFETFKPSALGYVEESTSAIAVIASEPERSESTNSSTFHSSPGTQVATIPIEEEENWWFIVLCVCGIMIL